MCSDDGNINYFKPNSLCFFTILRDSYERNLKNFYLKSMRNSYEVSESGIFVRFCNNCDIINFLIVTNSNNDHGFPSILAQCIDWNSENSIEVSYMIS